MLSHSLKSKVAYKIVICDLLKLMKPIITIISIIIGPHYGARRLGRVAFVLFPQPI